MSHVRRVWSEYLRGGLVAAHGKPKGGRRHAHLSVAQERAVLRPLEQQAHTGRVVTARRIKTRYEDRVGHGMPDATIYRLLARHQGRQVPPRPKHPHGNPAARAALKKTPGPNRRRGGWAPTAGSAGAV